MKRTICCALVLTAAAAGLLRAQDPPAPAQPKSVILQRVLVKVNGGIFTKTELEELQIDALVQENKRRLTPMDLQNDATLLPELIKITPELLAGAIDQLIVVQRGRELGLRMSDETYKNYLENIKKENQF